MSLLRCSRSVSRALRSRKTPALLPLASPLASVARRNFHAAASLWAIRSQVLKDVGEGITEVQIIQWYVEEGAHIEEWKPLCQYQSDKAVDDITSRYEGVIKKLHFLADDTVPTGMALCDIEVEDGKYPDDNAHPAPTATPVVEPPAPAGEPPAIQLEESSNPTPTQPDVTAVAEEPRGKHASLATPAVRGLLKSFKLDILDVKGTGKDGRVTKDDVHKYVATRDAAPTTTTTTTPATPAPTLTRPRASTDSQQSETTANLTPIQAQMFKTMTKSLTIPHFLFADELKVNAISEMRRKLANDPKDPKKITFLSFVIKAVSLALEEFPLLNARIDTTTDPSKPKLIMRSKHNIGVAMDTPSGLIVPNIKDVASLSVSDIASELSRLSALGKQGKLTPADLSGGTITVSNIGNIGGTYVSPVIVPTEVAILGIGKTKTVPVFDAAGQVTKGEMVNFSWSADHRVVDGATMARMATRIQKFIESPETMLLSLR